MSEDKNFEELMNKLEEVKYKGQGYAPGTKIEIDSSLFTDFVNIMSTFAVTVDKVRTTATSIAGAMGYISEEASKLQIRLAEQHVENVDKGITVDETVLDALDAEVSIEETKE